MHSILPILMCGYIPSYSRDYANLNFTDCALSLQELIGLINRLIFNTQSNMPNAIQNALAPDPKYIRWRCTFFCLTPPRRTRILTEPMLTFKFAISIPFSGGSLFSPSDSGMDVVTIHIFYPTGVRVNLSESFMYFGVTSSWMENKGSRSGTNSENSKSNKASKPINFPCENMQIQ